MQIAIPTNDQKTISGHFGRSHGFLIYQVKDQTITQESYKENTFTRHAPGRQHQHQEHGHGQHSHENIFEALADCGVVIAGGMGRRLYDEFMAKDIQVFLTHESAIDTALNAYANNELESDPEGCCHH